MDTEGLQVTFGQVITWSLLIGVAAWVSFMIYRAMDHPRLVLHPTPEGPRAAPRDVIQYAISMPILVVFWWAFFFTVFLINENHINVAQLFIFPSALIISIRALAFISPVTAGELGKVLPVALVAFVILDGSIRSEAELDELFEQIELVDTDFLVIAMVLFVDYVFTAMWYWGWIRWGRPQWLARRSRSVEQVAHDDGGIAVLPDADGADRRT